jgi:hypothetical protein
LQEEVEMRAVTLIISTTKLSGRTLKAALAKLMKEIEKGAAKHRQKDVTPHGKQTVKELIQKDAGASNIEATNLRVRSFDRVARKYGVDYAVQRDRSSAVPKYLIFFKGRDADALTAAFKEYSAKEIRKESERPSIVAKLRRFTELVRGMKRDPVKAKDKGLEL